MPRFPAKEDKIVDLAQQMYIGLRGNFAIWPAPPVATGLINVRRIIYQSRLISSIAKRAQVAGLAQTMVSGLDDNIAVYPTPPIATVDMTSLMNAYAAAKNAAVAAAAAAEAATTAKMDALEEMVAAGCRNEKRSSLCGEHRRL